MKSNPQPELHQTGGHLNQLLTLPEAARYLRVSQTTIYRMVRRRELSHCRIGMQLRFLPDDLIQASQHRRVASFHEHGNA